MDENGVTQTYEVISNLFNTETLKSENAKYFIYMYSAQSIDLDNVEVVTGDVSIVTEADYTNIDIKNILNIFHNRFAFVYL